VRIVRITKELQELSDQERELGRKIALVPTMGALHSGHLSLVELGKQYADSLWVSIFVNPTQFGPTEDFDSYPRTWEADVAACEAAGVDVIFAPTRDQLYPDSAQTWVDVADLSQNAPGGSRVGHFRGVTTVVSKLFIAAKPHFAIFGEKDFQQLTIVKRMVLDLGFDLEVVAGATVREEDGLALSSRNSRLSVDSRIQAGVVPAALEAVEGKVLKGERSKVNLLETARHEIEAAPLASIEYIKFCDPGTLSEVSNKLSGQVLVSVAISFPAGDPSGEPVRLIDNRLLNCTE
tara:strand:+ start:6062 stop:6937 length:876 start_codon:yes stop_codon:yes gene_type:complete